MDIINVDDEMMACFDHAMELLGHYHEGEEAYLAYVKASCEEVAAYTSDMIWQISMIPVEAFFDIIDDLAAWVHVCEASTYVLERDMSDMTDKDYQTLADLSRLSAKLYTAIIEEDDILDSDFGMLDYFDEAKDLYENCLYEDRSDEEEVHDVREYLRDNLERVQWVLRDAVVVIDEVHDASGLSDHALKMFDELKDIMHNYQQLVYMESDEIYDDDLDVMQSMIWLIGRILFED